MKGTISPFPSNVEQGVLHLKQSEELESDETEKKALAFYSGRRLDLMAAYEELYPVPYTKRLTHYVDHMQYEIKKNTRLEAAESLYKKGLEAIGLSAEEYESDERYIMMEYTMIDICRKNGLPIPWYIHTDSEQQSNHAEHRPAGDNIEEAVKETSFKEKTGQMVKAKDIELE